MPLNIENESLHLTVQKPGDPYRGERFDWTGQVSQIIYQGKHTFCTSETLNEELKNQKGRGLYNEFGIDKPIGYEDTTVGGQFPKIGVGLLTKESNDGYEFFKYYEIEPFDFSYSVKDTSLDFTCEYKNGNVDYAFTLDKRIQLNQNSFTIYYFLQNHGKKEINTNEYVHNFLSINNRKIDHNYKLSFPFTINKEKLRVVVNPDKVMKINKDFVTWRDVPEADFFVSNINTGYHEKGMWRLVHLQEKTGIQEATSFNISLSNLWGAAHVVSPELFFNVQVKPGNNLSWYRTYTIFDIV